MITYFCLFQRSLPTVSWKPFALAALSCFAFTWMFVSLPVGTAIFKSKHGLHNGNGSFPRNFSLPLIYARLIISLVPQHKVHTFSLSVPQYIDLIGSHHVKFCCATYTFIRFVSKGSWVIFQNPKFPCVGKPFEKQQNEIDFEFKFLISATDRGTVDNGHFPGLLSLSIYLVTNAK